MSSGGFVKNRLSKSEQETQENFGFRSLSSTEPSRSETWFAKVAAIFLAFAFYAFYQSTVSQTKSFNLPLQLSFGRNTAVLGSDVNSVHVSVRGPEKTLRLIKSGHLRAYVNAQNRVGTGEGVFPIYLERSGAIVDALDLGFTIFPDRVHISYEASMTKRVLLKILVSGIPEEGYQPVIRIIPNVVLISGPESVISEIETLNIFPVDLSGRSQSFTVPASIDHPENVMIFDLDKIEVAVDFIPPQKIEQILNLDVEVVNLRRDLLIVDQPQTLSVNIKIPDVKIEDLDPKDLRLVVDCAEIEEAGEYVIPLKLVGSAGDLYAELDPNNVTIQLDLKRK